MSQFYDDMRELAAELITEFKQGSISYVKMTPVAGATPDNPSPAVPTVIPVDAVARGVSYKYVMRGLAVATDLQVTFAYVRGTVNTGQEDVLTRLGELLLTRTSEQITVAGAGSGTDAIQSIDIPDFVDINSVRYKIVQIIGKPAAEPVAYTLIVRK